MEERQAHPLTDPSTDESSRLPAGATQAANEPAQPHLAPETPAIKSPGLPTGATQEVSEPALRLIEVMGRRTVIILAIGAVVGATALCLIGIFRPTLVPTQVGRFFLCLLIAFLFSVFVFALYPSHYELKIGNIIKMPFVLIGPAALWIALFLFLFYMLPVEPQTGQVFKPPPNGTAKIFFSTSWVTSWKPIKPTFYKLKLSTDQNADEPGTPLGVYVEFDAGHDEYTAIIGVGPSEELIGDQYNVTFSRSSDTYKVEPITKEVKK